MPNKHYFTFILILTLLLALLPSSPARGATYTVNTTNDVNDGSCNPAHCSLREAILAVNASLGIDTITFNIPGAGVHTITPLAALPALTDNGTTIDGYTQPGAAPAEDETPATILIEINGTSTTNQSGLYVASADNVVRGLAINRYDLDGIAIGLETATGNTIAGNHLGTDPIGIIEHGNGHSGVFVGLGATNNTIGGNVPADRNVLSANGWSGVEIHGSGTTGNVVSGNYIGTEANGFFPQGNSFYGVRIYGGAQGNTIGGDTPGERNIISSNVVNGVHIAGEGTQGNIVIGNYIGTTFSGTEAMGNVENGVYITLGAQNNTIGGNDEGEGNLISGNIVYGVVLSESGTMSNTVSGNYIGVDASGMLALGNGGNGIFITDAAHNTIGGTQPGEENLISGNTGSGIFLINPNTTDNLIAGNLIGTDATGTAALFNGEDGIDIWQGAHDNTVGPGNVVSGNGGHGILLGVDVSGTQIFGNSIGTNAAGTAALGNGLVGIFIDWAHDNTVGGTTLEERNLISGNGTYGVWITGLDATGNDITGNYIGVDASGSAALANGENGIQLSLGAQGNFIGGKTAGERNIISGNANDGITLVDSTTAYNLISGNYIGLDASGNAGLSNGDDGVSLEGDTHDNTIGGNTSGFRNVISGNGDEGIQLELAENNNIFGNYIGVNAAGTGALGNGMYGIYLGPDAQNNAVGSMLPGEGNVISANGRDGIYIAHDSATGNQIAGNAIGTNASGTVDLGNFAFGVQLDVGANGNTIGPDNTIAYNGFGGVLVDSDTTIANVITQNSIFSNTGLGIELYPGAHGGILPPQITADAAEEGSLTIEGTACPACVVELFASEDADGEGKFYLGSAVAEPSGNFTLTVSTPAHPWLTATATDAALGTSEFSTVYRAAFIYAVYLPMAVK